MLDITLTERLKRLPLLDKLLFLFFVLDPFYNMLIYAAFPWVPRNQMVFGVKISNWYLLEWLMILLFVVLVRHGLMALLKDKFVVFYSAYVIYRAIHDRLLGISYNEILEYLPSAVLFLTFYTAASKTRVSMWMWNLLATYSILISLFFGFLEAGTIGLKDGRMTSVFGGANFFAFYLFYMFFLLEMQPGTRRASLLVQGFALLGCILSGTRSALAVLLFILISRHRVLLALLVVLLAIPILGRERLNTENIVTMNARTTMWQFVYEGRREFNLVFGSGTNCIKKAELIPVLLEDGEIWHMQPQNNYILLLAEVGLVGLSLWSMSIVALLRALWPYRKDAVVGSGFPFLLGMLALQIVECEMFRAMPVALLMGLLQARKQSLALANDKPYRVHPVTAGFRCWLTQTLGETGGSRRHYFHK